MAEYIERETAIAWFIPYAHAGESIDADVVISDIKGMKAADVAPVRHGLWEWFEDWNPSTTDHSAECDDCGWRCSECKAALEDAVGGYWDNPFVKPKLNYCPNCGAKMDLEERS